MTFFQYTCFYIGLSNASGVNGSIINSSGTIFTVLLAFIVYKSEKPSVIKLLGCFLSFIGIVVINFRNVPIGEMSNISNFGDAAGIGVFSLKGEGLLFMASLSAAVGTIFNKNSTKKYNPITLSGSQLTFGGLCLTIIGLLCGGLLNPTNIKALLVHPGITHTSLIDKSFGKVITYLADKFMNLIFHKVSKAALSTMYLLNDDIKNGTFVGPRGLFMISGYPKKHKISKGIKKHYLKTIEETKKLGL
jgi:drug/metabolite transporter (DMT)-like permease